MNNFIFEKERRNRMKRIAVMLLMFILALSLAGCSLEPTLERVESKPSAGDTPAPESGSGQNGTENSRILIAYFSVPEDVDTSGADAIAGASIIVKDNQTKGSTEYVANLIQQTVGGDLFRIETVEQYALDHNTLVDQAAEEQDNQTRPELATHVENFEQYETILLGYPNWWGDMPMAVYSFLEEYDFGAKTVIPFSTHGGSGFSRTVETISEIQPGALIRDNGFIISRNDVANSAEDVIAWAKSLNLNAVDPKPESDGANTVATVIPDSKQQTIYLWEEGNMPAVTKYTQNNGGYADDPVFRPNLITFPVPEGTKIKGAILISAGGAFQYRSNQNEGIPVAEELSKLGYQSFVVNYRLRPYTQEEGALDLARAVRFVRAHAEEYGIEESDIAVMGFSAGGILSGEMLLNFDGTINGTALDPDYVPDELDNISADAAACGMIYSFYGRLSVASTDVEKFKASDLQPTYFTYGTRDPFVGEFEECVEALQQANVPVESHALDAMPHGFGATGGWIPDYDRWLSDIFEN